MNKPLKTPTARLASGALLLVSSIAVNATSSLGLESSSSQVVAGSSFTLNLVVSGLGDSTAPSLSVFDVDVSYDASLFSLSAITFGGGLGNVSLGEASAAWDLSTPGTVNLSEFSQLEINSSGCAFCTGPYLADLQSSPLTLTTLSFTAALPGTGVFGLVVNSFGDGFGDPLDFDLANALSVAAVPEPAALWLFGTALTGMGVFGCRQGKSVACRDRVLPAWTWKGNVRFG